MTDAPHDAQPPPPAQAAVPAAALAVPAPRAIQPAHPQGVKRRPTLVLRLIAILAFCKCLLTGGAGLLVMDLSHHDVAETLNRWLHALNLDPDTDGPVHKAVAWVVASIAGTSVAKLRLFGVVLFIYAVLYLAEAIGLWLEQTWAEWLTIVITGVLIPWEIHKMILGIDLEMALLFLLNVAVVAYLVVRVRRKLRLHHQRRLADAAAAADASAAASSAAGASGAKDAPSI